MGNVFGTLTKWLEEGLSAGMIWLEQLERGDRR